MYIYFDFASLIYRISYNNCCRWHSDCLISKFHNYLICRHILTILLLKDSIHENFYIFTIKEQIRRKPASTLDMEFTSTVIVCYCSPKSRFRATIQPLVSIFYDGFQSTLGIGKDIVKSFTMYTKHIIPIYYS